MRGPQSRCGCQLPEATSHRTGAKDCAALRVSLRVVKIGPAPCQGGCLHTSSQDPSNCSALPVLMSLQPRSRSAPPSASGERCVTGAHLPWHAALLPFSTGEGSVPCSRLGPPSQPLQCNCSELPWMLSTGVGWDEWGDGMDLPPKRWVYWSCAAHL